MTSTDIIELDLNEIKRPTANTGYTSCGFQSNLNVQGSLAREVTVDN